MGTQPKEKAGKLSFHFLIIPLFLFIIALTRPQWSKDYQQHKASGIDIVLAIDVSKSMLIDDFKYNQKTSDRLKAAKEMAKDFIKKRPNDRIGIVAFAGRPYLISPITMSHSWLTPLIDNEVKFSREITPGTAIGSAITLSSKLLLNQDEESKTKLVILITDGSSHQGLLTPAQAAKNAKEVGIKVYTLGIGTKDGRLNKRQMAFPAQEFDVETLKQIAEITGAEFFRAKTTEELENSFSTIDKLEKKEVEVFSYKIIEEFHHWFTLLGAILLTMYSLYYLFNKEVKL